MATNSDKDQSIERLLRQSRAEDPPLSGRGPCLDAETLAAWVDGGLASDALAAAEAHASGCARCQAMVAVLIKQPGAVQAAEERRAWGWGLGWLVPLAAGVAAVGLWFVVPQPATRTTAPRPDAQARLETPAVVVPAQPPASLADRRQLTAPQAAPVDAAPPRAAAERLKVENELAKADSADELRRDRSASTARPSEEALRGGTAAKLDTVGNVAAPPPAAPPPAPAAGTVAGAAPASALAASAGAKALQETFYARQIASPDAAVRWRAGANGVVEVSSNGGASWQAQSSGVTADLTAGFSPAPLVCWLVGRAGTVLRTTDGGRTWLRVVFPQAVDLAAVQATDALTATVTTSDGRVFRTTDAGRTWQ